MKEHSARHLGRQIIRRLGWRVALQRCGIDPRSVRLIAIEPRFDGHANTYVVESKTREALAFFERDGLSRLGWALSGRVVDLESDPYTPHLHRFLVEKRPLAAGHLPPFFPSGDDGDPINVPLGCHEGTGEPFALELFTPSRGTASVLISGTTGGGKSNTLCVLLEGLRGRADILGLDAKSGETLSKFSSQLARPYVDPICDQVSAIELLEWLKDEMTQRHRQPSPLHRPIFLVIEEWAALPERTDLLDLIDLIAAQGRSAHCGIIAVTQRPTASKVIRTTTRGNLPIKIAHSTVGDHAASEAILGGGMREAADLPTSPPGVALVRHGGGPLVGVRVFHYSKSIGK
jgi:hypothetical protein